MIFFDVQMMEMGLKMFHFIVLLMMKNLNTILFKILKFKEILKAIQAMVLVTLYKSNAK